MGGYGSGQRWGARPKDTVEDCLILSAAWLQSRLRARMSSWGTLSWTVDPTSEKRASARYDVEGWPPMVRLRYTRTDPWEERREELDYWIHMTTAPLPWGKSESPDGESSQFGPCVRWWFVCPLVVSGRACGRRVGKVYLPPGGRYFGCRHCYDLTYTSCQESHRYGGM